METIIRNVINGNKEDDIIPLIGLFELQRISKKIGVTLDMYNYESNGRDIDWWWSFNYNGKPYLFSGSLFNDSSITISLDTDKLQYEEDEND